MSFEFERKYPGQIQERIRAAARSRRLAFNMTQKTLGEKSGVPLSTLKRFEQGGEISLAGLLAIAAALDTLEEFENLFPKPVATSLDQLESGTRQRRRARTVQS